MILLLLNILIYLYSVRQHLSIETKHEKKNERTNEQTKERKKETRNTYFVLGSEPEISYLYSSKSGSKRLFSASHIPIPFGVYNIHDEQHLIESLAQLILDHLHIQRWLFKINDYYDGLGIAHCDITQYLSCYNYLVKQAVRHADQWSNRTIQVEINSMNNKTE
jgi:hypothetical protein